MLDISLGADGASLQVPQYVLEDALEKSGPRATERFVAGKPTAGDWILVRFRWNFFKSLSHWTTMIWIYIYNHIFFCLVVHNTIGIKFRALQ